MNTQLPYALLGAGSAFVGYVVLALTGSGIIGLVVTLVVLLFMSFAIRVRFPLTTAHID